MSHIVGYRLWFSRLVHKSLLSAFSANECNIAIFIASEILSNNILEIAWVSSRIVYISLLFLANTLIFVSFVDNCCFFGDGVQWFKYTCCMITELCLKLLFVECFDRHRTLPYTSHKSLSIAVFESTFLSFLISFFAFFQQQYIYFLFLWKNIFPLCFFIIRSFHFLSDADNTFFLWMIITFCIKCIMCRCIDLRAITLTLL